MGEKTKKATLGIPSGTAFNRLRKLLLFNAIVELNKSICVRCFLPIETVDDFTIEHIKPWEGLSAELFWDLDNIGYSHKKCNVPHKRARVTRKIGPEGTLWCYYGEHFVSKKLFGDSTRYITGKHSICKPCDVQKNRQYRNRQLGVA